MFNVLGYNVPKLAHPHFIYLRVSYMCCQPFNVHVGTLARASTTPTPIKGIDQLSDILEVKRVIARGVTVTY